MAAVRTLGDLAVRVCVDEVEGGPQLGVRQHGLVRSRRRHKLLPAHLLVGNIPIYIKIQPPNTYETAWCQTRPFVADSWFSCKSSTVLWLLPFMAESCVAVMHQSQALSHQPHLAVIIGVQRSGDLPDLVLRQAALVSQAVLHHRSLSLMQRMQLGLALAVVQVQHWQFSGWVIEVCCCRGDSALAAWPQGCDRFWPRPGRQTAPVGSVSPAEDQASAGLSVTESCTAVQTKGHQAFAAL